MPPRMTSFSAVNQDNTDHFDNTTHDDRVTYALRCYANQAAYLRATIRQMETTRDECRYFLQSLKDEDNNNNMLCKTVERQVSDCVDKVRNFTRVLQYLEHKMSLLEKIQLDYYAGLVDEQTYMSVTPRYM